MTRVEVIKPGDLTSDLVRAWSRIQEADPALHNPFCRPEYTQAVGNVRDDVEVAVLKQGDRPVGFLPFERSRFNIGRPVGGRVNNFQGFAVEPGIEWDPKTLIRDCGLQSWTFSFLDVTQQSFQPFHHGTEDSCFFEVPDGFDAYIQQQRAAGTNRLRKALRRERNLNRDMSPVRFEWHVDSPDILATLIKWKSQQFRRTGYGDLFAFDWAVSLMNNTLRANDESFSGVLTVLFVGDTPAAIRYALRSYNVMTGWFLGFNREFHKYSPGLILLINTAREMQSQGIDRYYSGTGGEEYKIPFTTGAVPVARGSVDLAVLPRVYHNSWRRARDLVRKSPLRSSARAAAHAVQPVFDWMAFR